MGACDGVDGIPGGWAKMVAEAISSIVIVNRNMSVVFMAMVFCYQTSAFSLYYIETN